MCRPAMHDMTSNEHQTNMHTDPDCSVLQCGLDGSRKVQTPMDEQAEVFRAQLQLGQELQRPISVR